MKAIELVKTEIINAAQQLHKKNMLAACDGNISYRVNDNEIWITPAGVPKSQLRIEDFAKINLDGDILSGNPSSERLMHLSVYRNCPEAKAVVHAHPPTAIAWTIACPGLTELPNRSMSELIIAAGSIPIAPYAMPGTEAMGKAIEPLLSAHRMIILARHGALSWGESVTEALNGMERLEHSADILMRAKQLGGLTELPEKDIEALWNIRKTIGNKTI